MYIQKFVRNLFKVILLKIYSTYSKDFTDMFLLTKNKLIICRKYFTDMFLLTKNKLIICQKYLTDMFLLTKNMFHTMCSYATQCFGQVNAG